MSTTNLERVFYPDYLDADYDTILTKFKTILKSSTEFSDIDYEGSNISALSELFSYIGDINTFYMNRSAKNLFIDTAEIYETVHRLSQLTSYIPVGYVSSYGTIKITLSQENLVNYQNETVFGIDDILYVNSGTSFITNSGIYFYSTIPTQITITEDQMINPLTGLLDSNYFSFEIPVRQGLSIGPYNYTGSDLINYQIILPNFNFDCGNLSDTVQPISVFVNGIEWTRVENFFDDTLNSTENNVFIFGFDKYQRYYIEFSPFKNYPKSNSDKIIVNLTKTEGISGNVSSNSIVNSTENFITNLSRHDTLGDPIIIENSYVYNITNENPTLGGANPESIDSIKINVKRTNFSQSRSVTNDDYKLYLEKRSEVLTATSWGEQEIKSTGDTYLYNKVYFSCIPNTYSTSTMTTSGISIPSTLYNTKENIYYINSINNEWVSNLVYYLKNRKIISNIELFSPPQLVFFRFDIGLRTKRSMNFEQTVITVLDKLDYYFDPSNRNFYENINTLDIHNFILDPTVISSTDNFELIKGIDSLIFRNVDVFYVNDTNLKDSEGNIIYEVSKTIFDEDNTDFKYPQYSEILSSLYPNDPNPDNSLRPIQLGGNQFPILFRNTCNIIQEK